MFVFPLPSTQGTTFVDSVVSMPEYLNYVVAPNTGFRVTRITDPGNKIPRVEGKWSNVARHHYSLDQAWNADQTLLMLDRGTKGNLFIDGKTYKPLFRRDGPREHRWHPKEPNLQIFVRANEIGYWDVKQNRIVSVVQFSNYDKLKFGPFKGNPSDDGAKVAVLAMRNGKDAVVFAYDLLEKKKYRDIVVDEEISYVTISPLGRYIVLHNRARKGKKGHTTSVYTLEGSLVGQKWNEYGRPSHFDLTVDQSDDEVAVGVSKAGIDKGSVIKRRLKDGKITVLAEPLGYGLGRFSHTSARNIKNRQWVYVTSSKKNKKNHCSELTGSVIRIKVDGSKIMQNLSPTFTCRKGYLTEAHASPSPDGQQVVFASNWDWGAKTDKISSFVIDLIK